MQQTQQKKSKIAYYLYFSLLLMLVALLVLHAFDIYKIQDDFLTRYLVALIFVMMILPVVSHVKFFDVIDIKRDVKLFGKKKQ